MSLYTYKSPKPNVVAHARDPHSWEVEEGSEAAQWAWGQTGIYKLLYTESISNKHWTELY